MIFKITHDIVKTVMYFRVFFHIHFVKYSFYISLLLTDRKKHISHFLGCNLDHLARILDTGSVLCISPTTLGVRRFSG